MDRTPILIVDDRKENFLALEKLLQDQNVELDYANSGNQALQMLLEREYALILMDVQMPEMDGFETAEFIRQDRSMMRTPIIFVSAIYKDEIHNLRGIESGGVDFLIKPIVPELLLGKVKVFKSLYENRIKLEENEKRLTWDLEVNKGLAELSNSLLTPEISLVDLAEMVLSLSKKLSCSSQGFILEKDPENMELVCLHESPYFYEIWKREGNDKISLNYGEKEEGFPSFWGEPIIKKKSIIVNPPELGLPVDLTSFMGIPVFYGERVLGEIGLAQPAENYGFHHIEALEKIAALFALAIHRKKEEEEKNRIQEDLLQAKKMQVIGQLAGGIAHDFNNQLAMIMGNAELCLQESTHNDTVKESLNQIINVSAGAADLTRKLLVYARKEKHSLREVNPEKIINEVVAVLNRTIDKKIKIHRESTTEAPSIIGDSTQIYSAILNIAINARDAMPNGGNLTIKTSTLMHNSAVPQKDIHQPNETDYLLIEISDNGVGIEKKNLEKIFDPYYTTKKLGQGTGMGLSTVQGIIKMHNGKIEIESEPGKGSIFRLFLPLKKNIS